MKRIRDERTVCIKGKAGYVILGHRGCLCCSPWQMQKSLGVWAALEFGVEDVLNVFRY